MKWTEKQQEAIDLREKNMLVAAAAGSGKTAVLVERIKQLLICDGVSIDEMLVVTFTNAAAAEMREKIVKAVTFELENNSKEAAFLRRQLNLLYKANISTFHSFALEVIRRFFYIINIDPNFKICDEAEQILLQSQAMDNLFEEMFDSEDEAFIDFLNRYATSKNEDAVKEMILEVYSTIQSVPNPWQWLEEHVQLFQLSKDEFMRSEIYAELRESIENDLSIAYDSYEKSIDLLEEAGAVALAQKFRPDLENIEQALSVAREKGLDELASILSGITYTRMVSTKAEKEALDSVKETVNGYRERCKEAIKKIQDHYCSQPFEDLMADMNEVYPQAVTLSNLVKRFHELYREEKQEKKLIDFNDIEHFALEILSDEKAAAEYRDKFNYIFIDEYQDSNAVQDTLIACIKRENNVFMVGDVKQSIYKFRLAEPEIFMEKYELYKNPERVHDAKIDLNINFRSKRNVITAVNDLFSKLMNGYDDAASLHKGVAYEGALDYPVELHLVDQKIQEDMEVEEEIKELKAAEMEAHVAASLIKDALGKPIFDAKIGAERPLTKRDIVILMRSQKNYADKFQQVLTEQDIPSHINDSDGYFDTLEIEIILNLLRVIDNRKQDIPLISVLHSSIMGFSTKELTKIRIESKTTSYFEAFARYCEAGSEIELRQKCQETMNKLLEWKKLAEFMPLEDFIWALIRDTGYFTFIGALPSGKQRQANVRALIDKAVQFQTAQMKGLYAFINYVDAIKNKKVPMGQVTLVGENDDVVRIMTIHKSKGLEFPMVLVAGLGKRFNNANSRKAISLHKNIGLGLRVVDRENHCYRKILLQSAIEDRCKAEDMEEEVRILYVAFTRAQDKLVLLGNVKDLNKFKEAKEWEEEPDILRASCYLDMIFPALAGSDITVHCHDAAELSVTSKTNHDAAGQLRKLFEQKEPLSISAQLWTQVDLQLSFQYGYPYARLLKSKFSVSKLNEISALLEKEDLQPEEYQQMYFDSDYQTALAVPQFAEMKKKGFSAAERGTILHEVMERWDFKKGYEICCQTAVSKDNNGEKDAAWVYTVDFIQHLEDRHILTAEEAEEAKNNTELIIRLQRSELGIRLAKADAIFREIPFNLMKEIHGEKIIVQGIIDCYFREGDHYILVDYKTNRIEESPNPEKIELLKEQYEEQIALYREAIETIRGVQVSEAYLYMVNSGIMIKF
ncbi:helicase-exonuclease AddAB subunit AddA [Clostridium aminobutyricum]|uniref:DNA 3'-5' helicase n=1 Tax=Clostridium aminobutyricum TaxID=33953 RepID=A0A939D745_CLOAM|nr:helicase-exonuclease AddAB subunit AddA [Clostridium aminobutyricum]MBN7771963.1 helicase-exonuclease AddAB subunit AddA [Clostridium aminobutyricum]